MSARETKCLNVAYFSGRSRVLEKGSVKLSENFNADSSQLAEEEVGQKLQPISFAFVSS